MIVDLTSSFHKMEVICVSSDPLRSRHHVEHKFADLLRIYLFMPMRDKGQGSENRQETVQTVMLVWYLGRRGGQKDWVGRALDSSTVLRKFWPC